MAELEDLPAARSAFPLQRLQILWLLLLVQNGIRYCIAMF